jgi:flagellar hook assembly protein FlgD
MRSYNNQEALMKKILFALLLMSGFIAASGQFTALKAGQTTGIASCTIAPNPFSPERGPVSIQYVCTSQNASGVKATVKIYNMAGKLVKTVVDGELRPVNITNTETWNGMDESGRMCLNGRYLLQIEIEDATGRQQSISCIGLVR